VHVAKAGSRRHCAPGEPAERCSGSVKGLAPCDVVAFHDGLEVSGRVHDQRSVDVTVAEEVPYLADGGGRGMSFLDREHRLGNDARDVVHQLRIKGRCPRLAARRACQRDTAVGWVLTAGRLRAMDSPNRAAFYTSGRASNEGSRELTRGGHAPFSVLTASRHGRLFVRQSPEGMLLLRKYLLTPVGELP
jgi:hypothetical protein